MCPYDKEIDEVRRQLEEKFHPIDIILFGSCAKERVRSSSDIDICVIMETSDKRQSVRDILVEVDCEQDLDVVVCTPDEWEKYKDNRATFIGVIHQTGVRLLGR